MIPPVMALIALAIRIMALEEVIRWVSIIRGASFCHVARRMHIGHERLDMTEGNQKCIGAAPSLVSIPMVKVVVVVVGEVRDSGV